MTDPTVLDVPLLILQRMTADAHSTTDALVDIYEAQLTARDEAIARTLERLDFLLDGDFAPSSYAIERAVMPLRVFLPLDGAS